MKKKKKKVKAIFTDCLYTEAELNGNNKPNYAIYAEGITLNVNFNPEKIKQYKNKISLLLDELPKEFKKTEGGGWSFLKMPFDKNEHQWGEQSDAQQLLLLGLATGKAKYLFPRELCIILPGSVPYIVIE